MRRFVKGFVSIALGLLLSVPAQATISETTNKVREDGNGVKTAFDFDFKIFSASDLDVYIIDDDGVATLKTLTTHYSVSINSVTEGGTVTYVTAPAADEESFIVRNIDMTQPTDLPFYGALRASQLENEFDRGRMIDQQLQEQIDRALVLSETSEFSDLEIPDPVANKILGWNSAGTALENKTQEVTETQYPGSFTAGADASKAASPSQGDIYFATDTNKLYKCISGGSWTTAMVFGHAVNFAAGADIASATTTDIGAATGNHVNITGTTTITGLGTVQAGTVRSVKFGGALTLTHNGTSLILPTAANITTAAGDTAIFVSEGSGNWRCLLYQRASGLPLTVATDPFAGQLLHVRDEKAANTAGGTFTSGAWQTRTLNTAVTNQITGASLATNQITLPAGTYQIMGNAPGYIVNRHVAKLYNVTDASDVLIGQAMQAGNSDDTMSRSWIMGRFTLASQKVLEIRHQCSTTRATDGFGFAMNMGVVEVYTDISIWKVA